MITLDRVKENEEIKALLDSSCNVLQAMDYTEHGIRHAGYVSKITGIILSKLGYGKRICELGRIAGYLHDVGNSINRLNHGITGATLLYPILTKMGMSYDEVCLICAAIGNHEEEIGAVVNEISAALIIADKSDAHKTRVNASSYNSDDIHDRVNFSIMKNFVEVNAAARDIKSKFYMNSTSSVMEYFQIYLARIQMSERAADFLGCTFKLYINDVLINSPKQLTDAMKKKITE